MLVCLKYKHNSMTGRSSQMTNVWSVQSVNQLFEVTFVIQISQNTLEEQDPFKIKFCRHHPFAKSIPKWFIHFNWPTCYSKWIHPNASNLAAISIILLSCIVVFSSGPHGIPFMDLLANNMTNNLKYRKWMSILATFCFHWVEFQTDGRNSWGVSPLR